MQAICRRLFSWIRLECRKALSEEDEKLDISPSHQLSTKSGGLRNQSDTVAAIVAGTILEGALETRLAGRMRRMSAKEHNELFHSGPLRNFQPKIILGEALNLFGPNTALELKKLADIRNIFAHTVRDITFETPSVRKLCF